MLLYRCWPIWLWLGLAACQAVQPIPAGTPTLPIPPLSTLLAPAGAKSAAIYPNTVPFLMQLDMFEATEAVQALALSPAGDLLAVGGINGQLSLWGTHGEGQFANLSDNSPEVRGLAFRSDGRLLAAQHDQGMITLWDLSDRMVLRQWAVAADAGWLDFIPAGLRFTPSADPSAATLYDLNHGQLIESTPPLLPFPSAILPSLSLDGQRAATFNGTIEIWQVASGRNIATLFPAGPPITALALNLDGSLLVGADEQGNLWFWAVSSGQIVGQLKGHDGPINGLLFRPDGYLLFSAGQDATIRLWGMPIP